jgi:TetR/AcrR family transcriptional repressor of uid operon
LWERFRSICRVSSNLTVIQFLIDARQWMSYSWRMGNSAINPEATEPSGLEPQPPQTHLPEHHISEGAPAQGARARQRADTRERIFETALREFREVGFAAAQIDRIANNAGIARGTFYFHFPTKDDVVLELARRINARIVERVAPIVDSKPKLQDFLLRVNDALIDEHSRVSEAGLNADVLSLYLRRPTDLRDSLHNVPTVTDELARHLRNLAEEGQLDSALSAEQLSVVIMSSLFGVLSRMPPGEQVRTTCSSLIEILVRGLQPVE